MTSVSAIEARRNLGRLLNIVSLRHEDLIIERAGKPVARLSPITDRRASSHEGKLDIRRSRGLGKELWISVEADAYVRGERESWA